MKRVFIVHGWGGCPKEGWFPWLKKELEKKGYKVYVPKMPNTEHPKINVWVNYLSKQVGECDKNTFFVGHSIGCQTVLRYLEKGNKKIGGAIFVAPWVKLNMKAIAEEGKESLKIVKPWITKPINFHKVKILGQFVSLFSDNDDWVTFDNIKIFEKQLHSDIVILHKKGHFSGKDKIKKLSFVLKEL